MKKEILVGCGVLVALSAICLCGWIISVTISPAKGIVEKTLSPDNIILNYEYFKKQFRDIEAIGKKIEHQTKHKKSFEDSAGMRKNWTFEDKNEHARLSSIIAGLQDQRSDMISDYNSKANMANRKIFMGKDCPSYIEQK